MGIVRKFKVAPYIDATGGEGPVKYVRIKKSTTCTVTMNGETETYDFIADETPTEELINYKPTIGLSLTMFDTEEDYKVIFDMLFTMKTGGDAHRKVLLVFYQEKGTSTAEPMGEVFKAWEGDAVVLINQLDSVGKNIDFDLSLNQPKAGGVSGTEGEPVFKLGTWADNKFTPAE